MLVLTRRKGEAIVIDEGKIRIQIIYIKRSVVALSIKAPPHMGVDREEVFLRKQQEKMLGKVTL